MKGEKARIKMTLGEIHDEVVENKNEDGRHNKN